MAIVKHYPDVQANPDFVQIEENILSFWQKDQSFKKSIQNRPTKNDQEESNEFIFYDGPPFANGLPHYGHLLTGFVKDVFARYATMKGKRTERRFGWDCHGLPAEMAAEKELSVSGRQQIMALGIETFNNHCRDSVMQYAHQWQAYVNRQARWVDFNNDYKTMDKTYMESVLWAFKALYDKGLIYQSLRVMPYSWACETPLSNFETRLDNAYRERVDKAITVAFTLTEKPIFAPAGYDHYKVLAWTTTPWTLPSNLALAVGKNITYAAIAKENRLYFIAQSSLPAYLKEFSHSNEQTDPPTPKLTCTGKELAGLSYHPLFPYFADHPNAFRILPGDFVTEGDGTGVVHLAPGFGEDDQRLCTEYHIATVCPVDNAGKFTSEIPDYQGMQVFAANDAIIKRLKHEQSWIKTEQYIHNYPHCWRTDTPLIYKAVTSWYVEVSKFKERMQELNEQIHWIPHHIKHGQFGKWLENARDWSISRNRFWGTPIPVWKSDNPHNKKEYVFGSIEALEQFFNTTITDLHRPYIDTLTCPDPDDPRYTLRRVEDVLDCWFESGSMPFAQVHYPFENKTWFEEHFPADFIVEYIAQTRGWFYTLMVLSTALFDRPPFRNCICHGVVLDQKGQKLSKRLNNYPDPMHVFNNYGADALRWVMMSAPIMQGGELLMDKEGTMIRDAVRLILKPIWNSYHFFTLYANADGIEAHYHPSSDHLMDRYILAKCKHTIFYFDKAMQAYNTIAACREVESFFEVLNNWYIRRNKERFWKTQQDPDKFSAYHTLYTVLHIFCRAIAPLLPMLMEEIWLGLGEKESVHGQDFPDTNSINDEAHLVHDMDRVREICNAALSIRNHTNIRIRQPLNTMHVVDRKKDALIDYAELIKDEVNVKQIHFDCDVASYADLKLKLHFPVLGKRLPHKMKDIIRAAQQKQWQDQGNDTLMIAGETLKKGEYDLLLEAKEKEFTQVLGSNDAVVILDTHLTDSLKQEGIARDIIRYIQQSRKEADLHISAHIMLSLYSDGEDVQRAVNNFSDYISAQTLAKELTYQTVSVHRHQYHYSLENHTLSIGFDLVG